eukprot:UN13744
MLFKVFCVLFNSVYSLFFWLKYSSISLERSILSVSTIPISYSSFFLDSCKPAVPPKSIKYIILR